MSSIDFSIFSDTSRNARTTGQLDAAMQVLMQDGPQHRLPIRERLMACLPASSAQANEALLAQCRAVVRQARALAARVKSRILTRREATLALFDQFPGLTRGTAERVIQENMDH